MDLGMDDSIYYFVVISSLFSIAASFFSFYMILFAFLCTMISLTCVLANEEMSILQRSRASSTRRDGAACLAEFTILPR